MSPQKTALYGAWKSPMTSDLIVADSIGVGGTDFLDGSIYWQELRAKRGWPARGCGAHTGWKTTDHPPALQRQDPRA